MQVDCEAQRFRAFQAACSAGWLGIIQALRRRAEIDDALDVGLRAAARAGRMEALSLLLEAAEADGGVALDAALEAAVSAGQCKAALLLLAGPRITISERVYIAAIRSGQVEMLDRLLAHPRSDDALHPWEEFSGVANAILAKNDDALELLLKDPRCLPPDMYCSPLTAAITVGDAALVARLLAHPCVDPNGPGEGAVLAEALKRPEILDMILADGRLFSNTNDLKLPLAAAVGASNEAVVRHVLDLPLQKTGGFGPATNRFPLDGCFALRTACSAGNLPMVELLLSHPRVGVDAGAVAHVQEAVECAVVAHSLPVLQRLLADERFDPRDVLLAATGSGFADAVELALAHPRFVSYSHGVLHKAALNAVSGDHAATLQLLLPRCDEDPRFRPHHLLCEAAHCGSAASLEILLADTRVDPAAHDCEALVLAARAGHAAIVKRLLQIPAVNPAVRDGLPLIEAAYGGHTEALHLLLSDARVDPSARQSEALVAACSRGHAEVVDLLLADPRVDPAAQRHEALFAAIAERHEAVALRLLADPRVDASARQSSAVADAARLGLRTVLRQLLRHSRINAAIEHNIAIVAAADADQDDVIEELLSHPGVSAGAGDNAALMAAARTGAAGLMEALLQRRDTNPCARGNKALMLAIRGGHLAVVLKLLADPRVDAMLPDCKPLVAAVERGCVPIVEALLSHEQYRRAGAASAGVGGTAKPAAASFGAAQGAAFNRACSDGNDAMVQLLLGALPLPAEHVASALCSAAAGGHTGVVRLLLADARCNSSAGACSKALCEAAGSGFSLDTVELLLVDGRADPAADGCAAVIRAIRAHDQATALRLLAHPRADSAAAPHELLVDAAKRGLAEVVACQLADPRLAAHVATQGSRALQAAAELCCADVVRLLLADERIDVVSSGCLRAAVLTGDSTTVTTILSEAGARVDPATELRELLLTGVPVGAATQEYYDQADLTNGAVLLRSSVPSYMRRLLRRSCPSIARMLGPPSLHSITAAELPDLLAAAWARRRHAVLARATAVQRRK